MPETLVEMPEHIYTPPPKHGDDECAFPIGYCPQCEREARIELIMRVCNKNYHEATKIYNELEHLFK